MENKTVHLQQLTHYVTDAMFTLKKRFAEQIVLSMEERKVVLSKNWKDKEDIFAK